MAEKDATGKGSDREQIKRKIQEILRRASIERADKSSEGRRSNRVEQKETAKAFEDCVCDEGYIYAAKTPSHMSTSYDGKKNRLILLHRKTVVNT